MFGGRCQATRATHSVGANAAGRQVAGPSLPRRGIALAMEGLVNVVRDLIGADWDLDLYSTVMVGPHGASSQ